MLEPATGDEVLIDTRRGAVALAIRDEVGAWTTVELGLESAREVAAVVGVAAGQNSSAA